MRSNEIKNTYISILREELVPATGCTEPIAIAYAAARLKEVLGTVPERIQAELSGNIIKNVKSVVVPNTGGLKGIRAAVTAGVIAGDASGLLQVIAHIPKEQQETVVAYAREASINVTCANTPICWIYG